MNIALFLFCNSFANFASSCLYSSSMVLSLILWDFDIPSFSKCEKFNVSADIEFWICDCDQFDKWMPIFLIAMMALDAKHADSAMYTSSCHFLMWHQGFSVNSMMAIGKHKVHALNKCSNWMSNSKFSVHHTSMCTSQVFVYKKCKVMAQFVWPRMQKHCWCQEDRRKQVTIWKSTIDFQNKLNCVMFWQENWLKSFGLVIWEK